MDGKELKEASIVGGEKLREKYHWKLCVNRFHKRKGFAHSGLVTGFKC